MVRTFSPMEQFFGERSNTMLTPLQYFGSALRGWWSYWDLTTIYQDSGTTLVTADGQSIGQVNDKSGNSRNVIQGTAGNKPLHKRGIVNGLAVGRFDGTDDWIGATASSAWAAANALTMVAICKCAAYVSGTNTIMGARSNATPANTVGTLERTASGTFQFTSYDGVSANVSDSAAGAVDTDWHTVMGTGKIGPGNSMLCTVDGTGTTSITAAGPISPNTAAFTITHGSRANSVADVWAGDLLDCFVINTALVASDAGRTYIRDWANFLRGL